MAKLASITLLATLLLPFANTAQASTGSLTVIVNPPEGRYEVLNDVTGEVVIPERAGNLSTTLDAGDYLVDFKDIAGYTTPADEEFRLYPGGNVTITGLYSESSPTSGILNVLVNPSNGRYEVLNDVTGAVVISERIGNLSTNLDFGDYVVDFKDIAGNYVTPADVEFALGPDNLEETVNGMYTQPGNTGILTIMVSPTEGRYEVLNDVTGAVVISERAGNLSTVLDFGDYLVDFKDIPNYTTPADAEIRLSVADPDIIVEGNYMPLGNTGVLNVNVSPANGRYEVLNDVTGAVVVSEQAGSDSFNLDFGDYLVDFKDITNYITPADVPFTLGPDNLEETVDGIYTLSPITGRVIVHVEDDLGNAFTDADYDLLLDSIVYQAGLTAGFDEINMPGGVYTVDARTVNVAGVDYAVNVTLVSVSNEIANPGDEVQYLIQYTPVAMTGNVIVTLEDGAGNAFADPGDYDILLDSAVTYTETGDVNYADQPAGTYTIVARPVTVGGTTYAPAVTLESADNTLDVQDEIIEFRIDYTAAAVTGTVIVTLEDGAGVAFADPGDYDILLDGAVTYTETGDVTYSSQPAGTYTIAARPVVIGGITYAPAVVLESGSDTIAVQDDVVEYRIDYVAAAVTGTVIVTVEDGAGNSFDPGDFDIEWNGNPTYINQTDDVDLADQPAGQYTVTAHPVNVGGTIYTPTVVLESASDTIAVQDDIVEYRVDYTAVAITGNVVVTLKDGAGNSFADPGDYSILLDDVVAYTETLDVNLASQPAGTYTIAARSVTVGGITYAPIVVMESADNVLDTQNETIEYRIDYVAASVTGTVIVTLEDGAGNSFDPGDFDIEWNGALTYVGETDDVNLADQPAGQYTVTAHPVNVGGTDYNPTIVLESASDTIAVQDDTVEYRIDYVAASVTGTVIVTLEDGAGVAFTNPGDYDILLSGAVTYTETLDVNYTDQPVGTYTIAARPVTIGGITYAPAVTLESASDTIVAQNDVVEYRVDYTAVAVTGNVVVTLEDGAGNSFDPGDFDIEWNGALTYVGETDDVNLADQPAGTYTVTARNVTVGGTIYTPTVVLESASDTIAVQDDTVEYRIDYLAPPVTGRVVVTVEDGLGGAFGNPGDFDILLDGAMAHAGLIADFDQTGEPAGVYTVAARPVTVGGTTYAPAVTLESADNTLDVQDEVIEYRIDYTASAVTGEVIVTLEDGLGGAFGNPGDYDILYNTNLAYVFQTADFDQLLQPAGAYTLAARNVTVGGTTYAPVIVLESASDTIAVQDDTVEYRIDYVVSNPDLTLAKSVNAATTEPGQTLTYTLRYGNDGALAAGNATNVTIVDNYDETRLTNITLNDPGCTDNGTQITCVLNDLAPGITGLTVTYTGVVAMGLPNGDIINNTATITSAEVDANPADNTASASVTVIPPELTVTKTVNPVQVTGDGQWVDYTITVARTNMTIPGSITATVRDTITNTGRVNGTQGGVMVVVPGGPSDTTCSGVVCTGATTGNPDPNLEEEAIEVALDNVGSTATITYRLMSGVSGPGYNPAVGTSMINTASVTYPGLASPITAQAVVSVPAQTVIVDPGTPGGGGGGGSYAVKKGDMKLEIEKLVSKDGVNYQNANVKPLAMVVPENKSTRLFYKVTIKNLGQVSAADIKFDHFFDEGKSDLTAENVNDLIGARWDNNGKLMIVDRVKVGETYTFTYNVLVREDGSNPNPAIDGLELTSFGSRLPRMQDGLTYLGIGDKIQTYIYGGRIPANVNDIEGYDPIPSIGDSPVLDIKVRADRVEAAVGDVINFTATLINKTDIDLTNLFVNHDYDSNAFEVTSAMGASDDGRSLAWKRALLRPGETLTLNFSLRVKAGAPVSTTVHNLTRALVSQYEGLVPYESLIYIIAGPSTTVEPGRGFELAQTGPMGWMIVLILITGLTYLSRIGIRHGRYVRGKRFALQSL